MVKSRVSLVKSQNSYEGTADALKLLENELKPIIIAAKKPVIKVNFVSTSNPLAATPAEAVKAVIEFIRQYSKAKITVAEEAFGGATEKGWQNYNYHQLKKYSGVELFDLKNDKTFPLEIKNRSGQIFTVPYSSTLSNSDFLISLTRPKTHDTVVVTLTGKNTAVGGINGKRRVEIHQGKIINQSLVMLLEKVAPHLAILDGTLGMEGDGPSDGDEVKSNWTAASLDWLAVDTLGAYLMGFDIKNIGYLYIAKEKGLGRAFPEEVEILGEKPEPLRKKFKPHSGYSDQIQWKI